MVGRGSIIALRWLLCAWLLVLGAAGRAEPIDASEQADIQAYLRERHLVGTWMERAVRAWVRMENAQDRRLLSEEIAPELEWMAKQLRAASPRDPLLQKVYPKLAEVLDAMRTGGRPIDPGRLEGALELFAEMYPNRDTEKIEGYTAKILERWWNDGEVMPLEAIPVGGSNDSVLYWPVLPKDEAVHGRLQLTMRDFVELLPFPIAPLEIAREPVRFDGIAGSAVASLHHDRDHGGSISYSWQADTWRIAADDAAQALRIARAARRELVRQLYRRHGEDGVVTRRLEEILFNGGHEYQLSLFERPLLAEMHVSPWEELVLSWRHRRLVRKALAACPYGRLVRRR